MRSGRVFTFIDLWPRTFLDGFRANAAQTANATAYCAPRWLAVPAG
jgi:hypothetical protein